MSQNTVWSDAGARQLTQAISGKQSALSLIARLLADQKSVELAGMAAGMAISAVKILNRVHQAGVRFGNAASWLNDSLDFCFVHVSQEFDAGPQRRYQLLHELASAIDACVQRGYISATRTQANRAADPAAPALRVEIVGLPDRITTTEIARDTAGNITSSAQLERDLAT